jgi:hypothetical protein
MFGCSTASEAVTETPAAPTASADVADASGGLHPAVAKAAVTATTVEEFEFRLDESGALIKQAVYHDDASAISEAVKAKALEVFPGSTIESYETEWYADVGEVHEVEVKTADGQACEVSATPDGTLRYKECELDLADVPAQITAAIKSAYPAGKILEVETKQGPAMDIVTAEVEVDGVEYYLHMQPDGALESVHKRVEALVEIPVPMP